MRLFAAVYPSPEALAHLRAALPAPDPALRWTTEEQWHLTVAFYGSVDDAVVPELTERLGRAAGRTPPLSLRIAGAGRFGRTVLWLGLDGDLDPLHRLAERAVAAGRRSGLAMEDRRFRAHLTLARARDRAGADLRPYVDALRAYAGPAWIADELVLVRSTLGRPRAHHEPYATWPLTGH